MTIQFRCSGCGEPIEVDEQYAGQAAACPYCHKVVSVPIESTYTAPPDLPVAHPVDDHSMTPDNGAPGDLTPPPSPASPLPYASSAAPDRQRAAATYGNYALVFSGLGLVLFLASIVVGFVIFSQLGGVGPDGLPDTAKMIEQVQEHPASTWLTGLNCGMVFFALFGLLLGIVSVTQQARGNWHGWLAVVISGVMVLCVCGSIALSIAMFGGGPS